MNRTKKLLKNIILFAIGSFAPKFLSFFLVPVYTKFLSTEAYGVSDLLNTICSLMLPVLTLDISDSILIYTIERKSYGKEKSAPLRYGLQIVLKSLVFLGVIFIPIIILGNNLTLLLYGGYIFSQYCISAIYSVFIAYLRGTDDIETVVFAGVINSFVTIISSIFFIVFLGFGLSGLLLANIFGGIIADFFIAIKIKVFKIYTSKNSLLKDEKEQMLRYSIPLIFSGLAWWINTSSDRLFVSVLIGTEINGIYAIANKIPTIINALHNIICQAMQLSVFTEIRSTDRERYLTRLYDMYSFSMNAACSILILLDKILAKFLFRGEFYVAWKYSPALLIAAVMYSVTGYLTTIYAAEKKTKLITKATIVGAGINFILNMLLIPKFGLYGAIVATVIGYAVICFSMLWKAKSTFSINFGIGKSLGAYLLLVFQWILILFYEYSYGFQIIILLFLCMFYKKAIIDLMEIIKSIIIKILKKKL